MTSDDLSDLNDPQRDAVLWDAGSLLVLAGPGSGKTRVLTRRVSRLLNATPESSERVLALTFTNKAAREMEARVRGLSRSWRGRALLTTFHAFAAELLRQHGSHMGLRPDFRILTEEADRVPFLQEALEDVGWTLDLPARKPREWLRTLGDLARSGLTVAEAAAADGSTVDTAEGAVYAGYYGILLKRNACDFDSLLVLGRQLLAGVPSVARLVRTMYRAVCVDEFQDTNEVQYQLLREIIRGNESRLFVVADDDQIIYGWNGATPVRIQQLKDDLGVSVLQLPANYRCPPEVIALANRLIRNNADRSAAKEPLVAVRTASGANAIRLRSFDSQAEESAWLAADLKARPAAERPGCVVLTRAARGLEPIIATLRDEGISACVVRRKDEFQSAPVRFLQALLLVLNDPKDAAAVNRLSDAFFALEGVRVTAPSGGTPLAWFGLALTSPGLEVPTWAYLVEAWEALRERLDIVHVVSRTWEWIEELLPIRGSAIGEALEGYEEEKALWLDLQGTAMQSFGPDGLTVAIYLQEVALGNRFPPVPPGAVRCMTVHQAKGLEFAHVYVAGLAEGQFPTYHAVTSGDAAKMEEERRTLFVAITRTQESLTLTHAREYFGYNSEPSRFLREIAPGGDPGQNELNS